MKHLDVIAPDYPNECNNFNWHTETVRNPWGKNPDNSATPRHLIGINSTESTSSDSKLLAEVMT